MPPKFNASLPIINLSYNNLLISCYNSHKHLGITVDNKLNFKIHIDKITSKISRFVGILSKLRYIFPTSLSVALYRSLVHSHLLFVLTVWGSIFPSYLVKLLRLQNKVIRIITNSDIHFQISPKFHNLGILKIFELHAYDIAKIMHTLSKPYPLTSLHSSTKYQIFIVATLNQQRTKIFIFLNPQPTDIKIHFTIKE